MKNCKVQQFLLSSYILALCLLICHYRIYAQAAGLDLNLGAMVQPVPLDAKLIDEDYYIWCGSMVKGGDNKFHLVYSRWPRRLGHYAWITDSEVAHAVADNPTGPYKFVNVILPARGNQYWDGVATHNPTLLFKNGKYYLYYMGTTGTSSLNPPVTMKDTAWWDYRNHQRIGVAMAEKPDGIWQRFDKPIIDISVDSTAYDALMVANPAVTFTEDNKVVLVYKQVEKNGKLSGGKVRFGVAFADSPTGPFIKEKRPVFEAKEGEKDWMIAEDPYIWFNKGYYYAIIRDVVGRFTGEGGALALLISKDAKKWQPSKYPKVLGKTFIWEDSTNSGTKLERPQLYLENGIPKILFGAIDINNKGPRSHSANIRIPLSFVSCQ